MAEGSGRVFAPLLLLVASLLALAATPSWAQQGPLTATGTVAGDLRGGETVLVRLVVRHAGGWQEIDEIEVDLVLRGVALEQFVIDPTHVSVLLEGKAGPDALGGPSVLNGSFFSVNAASIGFSARANQVSLTIPLRIREVPPPGARLTYQAHGFDRSSTPERPLTPPVETDGGFSWGTLLVAAIAALFVGSYLGSTFASRRRPPPRPSVYAAVQRRLEQERSET
jgi:hypothetical protein